MNGKVICFIIAVLFVTTGSCKKPESTPASTGGKGGSSVLVITPTHHGELVDTCTIYIKYNTQDAPANEAYDDSAQCVMVDTIPVATFPGLKQGNYYLFARGYHSAYVPPNVKGGRSYTINKDSTTSLYLPTYSY